MKYNINPITDYLEELTGCKTRTLVHTERDDEMLPLAISCCYSFCDVEFMETIITIAIPTEQENISCVGVCGIIQYFATYSSKG